MKTGQRKTAYCFLLAAVLLLAAGVLGVGNIRASYWNKAVWNTLIHPGQPISSNCLTSDGQVILLGEMTEERQVEVWFESPADDTAVLSLELLDSTQEAYLEAYLPQSIISLREGRTHAYMNLIPTQLASELEEAMEVDIQMKLKTERETLLGTFRLTLPAKEKELPVPGGGGGTGETEAEAGKTAVLTFAFENVFNVDGMFTVNDPDAIISQYTISVAHPGATDAVIQADHLWAVPSAEPVATNVSVTVEVTLKDDAVIGKMCTVSFAGIYGDGSGKPGNEQEVSRSATVTVKGRSAAGRTTAQKISDAAQPEEPAVIGGFPVRALECFSLEGALPVSMTLPENGTTLTVSLANGGLPALTRYSVDGGRSWYMLYYGGSIRADAAQMPAFEDGQCLLLDLHRTNWDSAEPVCLSAAVDTKDGRYTGQAESEVTVELIQSRKAETPLMIGISSPLELLLPASWAECRKEASLNRLELYDGLPVYREVADDSVRMEIGGDHVTVSVGDTLPPAGTYCLTITYHYGGVCFAQSEITFFANYSV